ncbi:mucin TcMUCII [Trypanosoma cruzi cruzi]|uniref:Putative mucin TcMUCII n=1 Tax=Trypanosoma cruzi TaxID=5693 RepID=A0A2V2UXR5_TRYCR|nr:mucin TcMUCII [Trypanosoma cruzi cruzi]PWU88834.1 putative mucin TcMUCII [Trypanosoma cruzi]
MMMMCRLLCALLVLALCCCPSVCVAEDKSEVDVEVSSHTTTTTTTTKPPTKPESPGAIPSQSSPLAGLPSEEPVLERGKTVGGGDVLSVQEQATVTEDTKEVKNGTTGPISGNNPPAEQTNKKSEAFAQTATATTTTTTTTKTPTTTTTTTQAPSTTTTEAPTTTTTHAPSRLREIDGSLSSSAWVCAPLVLAASALAYTALG